MAEREARDDKVVSIDEARTRKFDRLYLEADAIAREDAWKAGEVGFISRTLVQATLPYKEIKGNPPVWGRTAGRYSLVIQPGVYLRDEATVDSSGRRRVSSQPTFIGYPYGTKPRLILSWLGREIKRKGERQIVLGKSLGQFMNALGVDSISGGRNGSITQVREQMRRLFSARIALIEDSTTRLTTGHAVDWSMEGMSIADSQRFWWDAKNPNQDALFDSTVTLSERFFNDMRDNGVPLDMRILRALKNSPLELDLYSFLTYRFFTLSKRTTIPWEYLQVQFGTATKSERRFRQQLRSALKSVLAVYTDAKVDPDSPAGLILFPSRSSVRKIANRDD